MTADVSVVVCAYNAEATIRSQLDALAAQATWASWELVIVNNRCTDRTVEIVNSYRSTFPVSLRVVDALGSQGLSYARNAGTCASSGDLLLMCDADDEADTGWVEGMVRALAAVDLVGGHLDVDKINGKDVRSLRASPTSDGLPDAFGISPYPVGANCGMRRSVIETLGGWDPGFTTCGDDVDFGIRAALAGFNIGYAPDAVVHYRLRSDLRAAARQRYQYAVVSMELRRRYRRHVRTPAGPPLRRQIAWVIVHTVRYPRLGSIERHRLVMVGAATSGRIVGGLLARLRSRAAPSREGAVGKRTNRDMIEVRGGGPRPHRREAG